MISQRTETTNPPRETIVTHRLALPTLFAIYLTLPVLAGDFSRERLDNWPHWRGPLDTGFAPKADPPITWDNQKNVRWKVAMPGKGSATPIVWGKQVFVVNAVKTDRVATPAELPKIDPAIPRKTTPPTHYHQ